MNDLLKELTSEARILTKADVYKVARESRFLTVRLPTEAMLVVGIGVLAVVTIPTGRFGRIEDVVVRDRYRSRGIGKGIMGMLIEEGRNLGLLRLDLTSNPRRETANRLYQNLGFSRIRTNMYRLQLRTR